MLESNVEMVNPTAAQTFVEPAFWSTVVSSFIARVVIRRRKETAMR
jgi:hypothetical protein